LALAQLPPNKCDAPPLRYFIFINQFLPIGVLLILGVGAKRAQRWLALPWRFKRFQPSEIMKKKKKK